MPPKRRTPAKAAHSAKPAPPPPNPAPAKSAPAPPPPPPPPIETPAAKVRKEWFIFIDTWYEPQKKKLQEQVQKDLTQKYKKLGSSRAQLKAREAEIQQSLTNIPEQLAASARAEWEKRLRAAHLQEDQWDDMTFDEQQAVLGVFVGFFGDDDEQEDESDDDDVQDEVEISAGPSSEDDSAAGGQPSRIPTFSTPLPTSKLSPNTPITGTFQFVNPTSLFDLTTPPNPTKHLPALSMDHLATLSSANAGRQNEPVGGGGVFGFHQWASEAGIASQQPQAQVSSTSQPSGSRPRATENISREASAPPATQNTPSPPLFSNKASPQYSPPIATKVSPPTATETLPLGKRYIGPVIVDEEPDPIDEELLKSKMAAEYQQYKISLRIQMIHQFHEEAAQIEVQLVKTLLADEGTKESRAKAVQEHEASMMLLRERKEEERKRISAEERDKRREELRLQLAQAALRSSSRNREPDSRVPKANPPKPWPDKVAPQRGGQAVHLQENVLVAQAPVAPSSKLEPPASIKKSNSALSQDEAASNEALFANAAALLAKGKLSTGGLTPSQAATNEAKFANAAAQLLASRGKGTINGLFGGQLPSAMNKANSSRAQEPEAPQLTVNVPDAATPPPASAPTTAAGKGKKGKKSQPVSQPGKTTVIAEEPDIDAEPPPTPAWGTSGTGTSGSWSAWGTAPAFLSQSKRFPMTGEVDTEDEPSPVASSSVPVPPARTNAKKAANGGKKSKGVTITQVSGVDADPIVGLSSSTPSLSSGSKAMKSAWGSANGKRPKTPAVVVEEVEEESEPEPVVPPPPPVTSAWGKKSAKTPTPPPSAKPSRKAFVSEEQESDEEDVDVDPTPSAWTTKGTKTAWSMPPKATKKATQQAEPPRRGTMAATSKFARVESVPDPEDDWAEVDASAAMPRGLEFDNAEGGEGGESAWSEQGETDYWPSSATGQTETQTAESAAKLSKHVRWTPALDATSDEEDAEVFADELQSNIWLQYAIHQGDEAPEFKVDLTPGDTSTDTRIWEQGKGKKKVNSGAEAGKSGGHRDRVQNASMFDKAAFGVGQWPTKMENWLSSAPLVGQSSGSARFF
ncbi:hypothetical protein F5I97DRAFT_1931634 [Phlebopus sp. FC_14]|nr:hypothetical protein F5I97DRAFT_1931634 [Phlebopus sp. FC_14]